jgi:hypothetical protein
VTVHRGSEDDMILQEQGPAGFRQSQIPDIGLVIKIPNDS